MADFDEDLIRALQLDGRAQFSGLAVRLGMHRAVIARRVRELIVSGEIRVVAAMHPSVLGFPVQAHLRLTLTGPTSPIFEQIAAQKNVAFLSETTGEAQAVVEVWAESHADLSRTIAEVRSLSGVAGVQLTLYESVVRGLLLGEEPGLSNEDLDAFDMELLRHLQQDGRLTFGELGRLTGRSASACRSRVLRLLDARVMRVGAVRSRIATNAVLFGVGILVVSGSEKPAGLSIEEVLLGLPGIEVLARAVGRYSLIASIAARSMSDYTAIIRGIRAHPEVALAETWIHTPVWVERYEWGLTRAAESSRARRG